MRDYEADVKALNDSRDQHQHAHKFQDQRTHRLAHKAAGRAERQATVRRATRTLTRSEWLDRSLGDVITAYGHKQPGRRFGPAAYGSGLGPREAAAPLLLTQRLANYSRQRGATASGGGVWPAAKLTPKQARRAIHKQKQGARVGRGTA